MKLLLQRVLSVAFLLVPALSLNAAAGQNNSVITQAAVATCTAAKSTCSAEISGKNVLNAVGDVMKIEFTESEVKDLGTISEEKTLEKLELPIKPGEKKFYSFTPTSGESAGQKIDIAFVNMVLNPGTRLRRKFSGQTL